MLTLPLRRMRIDIKFEDILGKWWPGREHVHI